MGPSTWTFTSGLPHRNAWERRHACLLQAAMFGGMTHPAVADSRPQLELDLDGAVVVSEQEATARSPTDQVSLIRSFGGV